MADKGKKVLVVGGGGREDALVWKLSQSPRVSKIFCAPGNGGIAQRPKAICLPSLKCSDLKTGDLRALRDFAKDQKIDLTIIGDGEPLSKGIVDGFEAWGLKILGPREAAAQLESSKVWAKKFMEKYGIPTADFMIFEDPERAKRYAKASLPCVIKAEGLTRGKGVFPCFTEEEACRVIDWIMIERGLGDAGKRIIVEEFLRGKETTFMVLTTDGWRAIPLLAVHDYKYALDGDRGPMTGGMGGYCPDPLVTKELEQKIMETIIYPTLSGMEEEKRPYKGVLYAGLMVTSQGPKVLEFNCRFGDPELQVLVPLMKSDLFEVLMAVVESRLDEVKIEWEEGAAVCVVMASRGYPGTSETGKEIKGLTEVANIEGAVVFHAGTRLESGVLKTDGGRVLGVTVKDRDIPTAAARVYGEVLPKIRWDGEHHRIDIGKKALECGVQIKMGF